MIRPFLPLFRGFIHEFRGRESMKLRPAAGMGSMSRLTLALLGREARNITRVGAQSGVWPGFLAPTYAPVCLALPRQKGERSREVSRPCPAIPDAGACRLARPKDKAGRPAMGRAAALIPSYFPPSWARRSLRRILPTLVLGSSVRNSTASGHLYLASLSFT